jgi:hypothetical protein
MTSRFLGAGQGMALIVLAVSVLASAAARAEGPGPAYTYIGGSYEWTDVKYGVNPSNDERYNNGTIEGFNVDASLGVLSWLHLLGQYFDGDCTGCGTNLDGSTFDQGFEGFKLGAGVNIGFDTIGWNERTDLVLRAFYVDVEQSNLNPGTNPPSLSGDGWAGEGSIRSQISPRADFEVGYAYQDVGSVKNADVFVGLNYRVAWGIALLARGIIFDNDTGFELGARWYFGDFVFGGRDSIVR